MYNHAHPITHRDRRSPELSRHSGTRQPYGLRQEGQLRRGLRDNGKLLVHYNASDDAIYKMDAVVRFREMPKLPAVGIQFTTRPDPEKLNRTIAAVRRSRIVSRLLYLQADCPLHPTVFGAIGDLIRLIAGSPAERGIVYAVLTTDGQNKYWFRETKCFPLETTIIAQSQQKEEKAA
jgi:hypothetical protein